MLTSIIKKLLRKPLSALPLLAGFIVTTSLAASIPIFSAGTLLDVLLSDLGQMQIDEGVYPGNYIIDADLRFGVKPDERLETFEIIDSNISKGLAADIPLEILSSLREINSRELSFSRPDLGGGQERWKQLVTISNVENHVEILYGRMAKDWEPGNILELMVTEASLLQDNLLIDQNYTLAIPGMNSDVVVRVVGVFGPSDIRDPYWFRGMEHLSRKFLITQESFYELFFNGEGANISRAYWAHSYEYQGLETGMVMPILSTLESHRRLASRFNSLLGLEFLGERALERYQLRRTRFNLFLAMLILPVLILLALYILMISRLIIDGERHEISMLQSRGAGQGTIVGRYALEYGILAGIAVILGPFLGLMICRMLGSSTGFMEFVNRRLVDFTLSAGGFLFSAAGGLLLMILVLIPVHGAARTSIVQLQTAKVPGKQSWASQRWFLEIGIIAASLYGLDRYRRRIQDISGRGELGNLVQNIDPLLFLMSTAFILGVGLLFLRLYPSLIRGLFLAGKRRWSPAMHFALLNAGRPDSRSRFVMIFLIFSISTGLYSAISARIINRNLADDISYRIGADLRIMPRWIDHHAGAENPWADPLELLSRPRYQEPPRDEYRLLPGVQDITAVYLDDSGQIDVSGQWQDNVQVMGVVPDELGRIGWFRGDLLPVHWYNYLNLLARDPKAVLISGDLADEFSPGEAVTFRFADGFEVQGSLYAFVSHWPGWDSREGSLVVANLDFLQTDGGLTPYEFWLQREDEAADTELYAAIDDRGLEIQQIQNRSQQLIRLKNDALVQGINGALTLSFLLSMLLCFSGFLLHLLLSITERRLQFGVIRAMGLSEHQVALIPAVEMALMLFLTLLAGVAAGGLSGALFGPLLEILAGSSAIPFAVVADQTDFIRIYLLGGSLAVSGYVMLRVLIRKLNVSQSLKLGEG